MPEAKVTSGTKLRTEIERRTRDTAKLIELEAQKVAVGEMVLERLDSIMELLQTAGFKVQRPVPPPPNPAVVAPFVPTVPPNTTIVPANQLAAPAAQTPVKNPCAMCGQEAAYDENMPDGTKKYYCRPHGQQRMREKQEEAEAAKLFQGSTGTMFTRPTNPNAPPPKKIIIQADPNPSGTFNPNGAPPPNNVLDD
ncbi:MAG TPA: hypothetical protein VKD24_07120 [Candidatus Angelobacter sp.]|nr:hypothetical protein [Candidatus Angelobacter sp.]